MDKKSEGAVLKLVRATAADLWRVYDGLESKLIFPDGHRGLRISEQESRVILTAVLATRFGWLFSVETPTVKGYVEKGNKPTKARSDLSLYHSDRSRWLNIELKAKMPPIDQISKDLIKLVREGIDGLWFHTLESLNAGTLPRLFEKMQKASSDAVDMAPSLLALQPRTVIFAFCVLDGTKGKMLLTRTVSLEGSHEAQRAALVEAFDRASLERLRGSDRWVFYKPDGPAGKPVVERSPFASARNRLVVQARGSGVRFDVAGRSQIAEARMIDLLVECAGDPGKEAELKHVLTAHMAAVAASAGRGDRSQVARIERAVQADPGGSFVFEADGAARLVAGGSSLPAGRFETPSLATLRRRVLAKDDTRGAAQTRLWVLLGTSPATDIGSLQATAGEGTVFQVASQFNCLEAIGPHIVPIAAYFDDSTQGPRAAISAFPGTFLRHYSAPAADGSRFAQTTDGLQLNLLEAVCLPDVARVCNGYLRAKDVSDPETFAAVLEERFNEIRVGVHCEIPVLLGYDWDGAVEGDRRIDQVFTSTFAGRGFRKAGGTENVDAYERICGSLLRAAYLGTLLAALASRRNRVVLTLIGGGVFGNPIPLIWKSILWAIGEVDRMGHGGLDIVVNSRNLRDYLSMDEIQTEVQGRAGAVVEFERGRVSVWR